MLAEDSGRSREYSTRSRYFSKWYSNTRRLCSFERTQIWSLHRYTYIWIYSNCVHSALYFSARGTLTCQGRPGSFGYEVKDANTYASWNVDYLKMDTCQHTGGRPAEVEYSIMRDALNATGRPIFFSLCGMYRNRSRFIIDCSLFFQEVSMKVIFGRQMLEIVGELREI